MADEKKYKFAQKVHSKGGKLSSLLALASALLFFLDAVISFANGGKAGPFIGGIAIMAMLLSIYGFYVGMKSFAETGVSPLFSIVGSIACGVIMVGWLTLFLTGVR
ncbi:MAG TPA: DUF6142 family protein [Lachnospiraceae bacterium]|nr:DUF6142 family protein [Lachnospiraceae bacterium]